uniref:RRM domain-containing protein n=1 Tax=Ananas comosus var. bracteatus TaxID=296719 RepID=A0A6V7QX72_ANACO
MDGTDQGGDDRTFRVNFTTEGLAKLRDRVKEKLKEYMGDYTDDTLVEYVVVLLRNGRSKDEARKELHVFLGDDSVSFVSWLWDHLSSNLNLYVQSQVTTSNDASKSNNISSESSRRNKLQREDSNVEIPTDTDRGTSKITRRQHKREWRGLGQEEPVAFPLRSVVTNILHAEEKTDQKSNNSRRSHSPNLHVRRKREREEEKQPPKRDLFSHPVLDAPRRLLQFAVRDAVKTVQQTSLRTEPTPKRLRSVVSTSTAETVQDKRPQRTRSMLRAPGAITAIKAAAEAAEDVIKSRPSGSVFDRLGQQRLGREQEDEDEEYEDVDQRSVDADASRNTMMASKDHDSLMVEYNVSQEADVVRRTMVPRDVNVVENQVSVDKSNMNAGKPNISIPNKKDASLTEKVIAVADVPKETQKTLPAPVSGLYTAGHPLDDVNSRTLFVSNVHFAATKDALSRHFNKFGAVLKVIIVTDAATGQPTGSAFVEFLHKESAESALSLNGTSFMSRILKVVRRSSHEAAQMLGWPRISRVSPFASRLGRLAYPRGVLPGAFRGRLPIKGGARSLQWKRDEASSPQLSEAAKATTNALLASGNQVLSPTARSLTYTRTEAKADGSAALS